MDIAVVGTGYVGLVLGACLAHSGHDVVCCDIDRDKIALLNRGEVPIHEPGLDPLIEENVEAGRLRFSTDVPAAVRESYVVFIAVGTPPGEEGEADLRHVLDVAGTIGESMEGEKIVVTKSTVPVGTAAEVRRVIEAHTDHPVHLCSNPEFLKEGAAVEDFMKPDRVVVGVDGEKAARVMRELYEPFVRTGNEILLMDIPSAEITKYAANAMLASRISFMNLIARLCERVGADVDHVRRGLGTDTRIGPSFLFAGVGYGGSCFPKDVKALIRTYADMGEDASLFEAIEAVNEEQKRLLLRQATDRFGEDLAGRRFAVWGLSFKPDTDDMREAPSLVTIRGLLDRGATVVAHDPVAVDEARGILADAVEYRELNYEALRDADALFIHTEWHPYRRPDFERMRGLMKTPIVFDGRNLYHPERMREEGFEYHSVGRPAVTSGAGVEV